MTQIYKIGTATVTNGSTTVSGTDTGWATALVTGGLFTKAGLMVPIESVESDTALTLALPWPGSSGTGVYAIVREQSSATSIVHLNDRLAQILAKMVVWGIPPTKIGTLTERDALDLAPEDDQFVFLRFEEDGSDVIAEFYRWDGTEWLGPFDPRGEAPDPDVNAVTTPDGSLPHQIALTQEAFDLIETPDASTLYVIYIPEEE